MFLRKMRAHLQIVREVSNILLILKRRRRKYLKVVKIGNYLTILCNCVTGCGHSEWLLNRAALSTI